MPGGPLLLEGGLDWKAMALSPEDMDFIEANNGAARDIARSLGVPPNTCANYQEANRAFYRLTVLPVIARTAASFPPGFRMPMTRRCGWSRISSGSWA